MKCKVAVSDLAEDDLVEIVDYILDQEDVLEAGLAVQNRLEEAVASLSENPNRGRAVPALRRLGVQQFRELFVRPWRIIYRIDGRQVRVVAIVDGRRSADDLLRDRLLREIA